MHLKNIYSRLRLKFLIGIRYKKKEGLKMNFYFGLSQFIYIRRYTNKIYAIFGLNTI